MDHPVCVLWVLFFWRTRQKKDPVERVLLKTQVCDGEAVLRPEDIWAEPAPREVRVAIPLQQPQVSPALCSGSTLPGCPWSHLCASVQSPCSARSVLRLWGSPEALVWQGLVQG